MTTVPSTNPSCALVSPADIKGRIDAAYYHSSYLPLDNKLSQFLQDQIVALDNLLGEPRRILYQQTTSYTKDEAPVDAIPFISGVDLDGKSMTINWDSVRYVDRWMLDKYPKGRLLDGTLLIKVKGPNQHTAFVSKSPKTSLISGTIFFSKVKGCNPYYLAAYLSSPFGCAWRSRLRTNTTVEFIGNDELRAVPIFIPDQIVQNHIGEKLKLAEHCKTEADKCLNNAKKHFSELLAVKKFSPLTTPYKTIEVGILAGRINGEFYLPRYFNLEDHLRSLPFPVLQIRELLREPIIRTSTPKISGDLNIPCVRTSDIDPQEINWRQPSLQISRSDYERHVGKLEENDVVYASISSTSGEAAIVIKRYLPLSVGGDVSVLRTDSLLHPGYLSLFLNSKFGVMQFLRFARGSMQRRVYPEDIGAFLIACIPYDRQRVIGNNVIRYQKLREVAIDLATEARADVDALIENKLDFEKVLSGDIRTPTWENIEKEINKED